MLRFWYFHASFQIETLWILDMIFHSGYVSVNFLRKYDTSGYELCCKNSFAKILAIK